MNILFVCSRNKWRSRTAETVFKNRNYHDVKSAGTSAGAVVKLNEKLLIWADLVFVMEQKHQEIIKSRFKSKDISEKVVVLDIMDNYKYMDEELVQILEAEMEPYLN